MRQVMEIKPAWLLEGPSIYLCDVSALAHKRHLIVAPHYFKPEDLEVLDYQKKRVPKVVGLAKMTK
jgi:hypothetical protein